MFIRMMRTRRVFLTLFLLAVIPAESYSGIDPMIIQGYKAYAERDVRVAEELFLQFLKKAEEQDSPDSLRARLGLAYIYILSADLTNVPEGKKQLEYIIDRSKKILQPGFQAGSEEVQQFADLRGRAILLLGRSYHLDRSSKGKEEEANLLEQARVYYRQYLEEYPEDKLKSRVVLYIAQTYLRSEDAEDVNKAISLLEGFLNGHEGKKDEHFVQMALALGSTYQLRKHDLSRAVSYLSLAVEQGIADKNILSKILGQVATIYDKYLHQPEKSLKYYQAILEQFPLDKRVNVIRKRIEEIKSGAKR